MSTGGRAAEARAAEPCVVEGVRFDLAKPDAGCAVTCALLTLRRTGAWAADAPPAASSFEVALGLGRIAALYCRSPTLYQIY